ncbi:MAG: hypothetical protein OEZ58_17170 [Gammaproteobacteria bacterium]|nr:hypothetical protein [Gammaproteobacteria bacterium]MDH5730723.1 hypothetical protein [Gammaproteobacteria bacterium]
MSGISYFFNNSPRYWPVLLACLAWQNIQAESLFAGSTTALSLGMQSNQNNQTDDQLLNGFSNIDFVAANGLHLLFSANALYDKQSSGNSSGYTLGIGNNPVAPINYSLLYDYWSNQSDILSHKLIADIVLQNNHWSLSINQEARTIFLRVAVNNAQLQNALIALDVSSFILNSVGTGLSLAYYSDQGWYAGTDFTVYTYSADPSKLLNPSRIKQIISSTARDLSYGLEKNYWQTYVGYSYKIFNLAYTYGASLSAIDNSQMISHDISFSSFFTDSFGSSVFYSQQISEPNIISRGLGLSIDYYW